MDIYKEIYSLISPYGHFFNMENLPVTDSSLGPKEPNSFKLYLFYRDTSIIRTVFSLTVGYLVLYIEEKS